MLSSVTSQGRAGRVCEWDHLKVHSDLPYSFQQCGPLNQSNKNLLEASNSKRPPWANESQQSDNINPSAPNHLVREIRKLHVDTAAVNAQKILSLDMDSTSVSHSTEGAILTPPNTPKTRANRSTSQRPPDLAPISVHRPSSGSEDECPSTIDIAEIDFDTSNCKLLGAGLWSKVYELNSFPSLPSSSLSSPSNVSGRSKFLTPPSTPQKPTHSFTFNRALALKVATRPDALPVFHSEARILEHLQRQHDSEQYIIPFHGLSIRSQALLFHCANHGTLESLITSSTSWSIERVLSAFATIAPQLIRGLAFIHKAGVIHADIKPANILLDETEDGHILARYADFSASSLTMLTGSQDEPSTPASAGTFGGTWDYMAPEQLTRDVALSTPTSASDVYALGITLLSLLVGGSPYEGVSANVFMLREAVKMGDSINFAMREPEFENRVADVENMFRSKGGEGSLVRLLEVALKRKRESRVDAEGWAELVERSRLAGFC